MNDETAVSKERKRPDAFAGGLLGFDGWRDERVMMSAPLWLRYGTLWLSLGLGGVRC